jgi:hypothetical protein
LICFFQGWSVSLSNDGYSLAIGAPRNNDSANWAGHARLYDFGMLTSCFTLHTMHNSHSFTAYIGVEVAIEQSAVQEDPASASPIVFDVLFTEPVSNFATGDVTVTSSSGEQLIGVVESVSGSLPDNAYTVTVTVTLSGIVTATIAGDVASDVDGVPNFASTSIDNQVVFDKLDALIDDVAAIEAKLDDKTQCKLMVVWYR